MYAATYNCIRHLPDIRYDFTSRGTTVGNTLPAVAFPSCNQHTPVFTVPYPGPGGPWQPVHRSFQCKKVMASLSPWHMWPLNIRWRSCTKMCHWLRGITLSSNQYFATNWFWWLTPISAKGACIAWYWSLYLNVFVHHLCEVIDKAPLWMLHCY